MTSSEQMTGQMARLLKESWRLRDLMPRYRKVSLGVKRPWKSLNKSQDDLVELGMLQQTIGSDWRLSAS